MPEKSSFFDSINKDRLYNSQSMADHFYPVLRNGYYPNEGYNLQVVAGTGLNLILKSGMAWIEGRHYRNTSDLNLKVDAADGLLHRRDRIVIRCDYINREIRSYVKKGVKASSPVAPTLTRNSDMYELGIADVYISAGATSIRQQDITDLRMNNNLCGMVHSVIDPDWTRFFDQFQDWYTSTTKKYDSDFLIWFNRIKDILDGNVAGNLQNQIDKKADILSAQMKKITQDNGHASIVISDKNINILTEINNRGPGVHTISSGQGVKDNPGTSIYRGIAVVAGPTVGFVIFKGTDGKLYTNHLSGGTWMGWLEHLALEVNGDLKVPGDVYSKGKKVAVMNSPTTTTMLPGLNGWANFGQGTDPIRVTRSSDGVVHFYGVLKNGGTAFGTVMTNVPAEYRPKGIVWHPTQSKDATGQRFHCDVEIHPNGNVIAGGDVRNTWIIINCTWNAGDIS
ncbi:hypothetical protein GCM10007140_06270 [Priestia taiwanensis]|uniref:Uncharacterized protein n=2 Tax=Priestia taiwanensis TaxID=1347902 RepID=A0A917EL00_9BACI|nr:hypothetical protein GCM10007140_06270 [Priestia taiwanensis]